MHAACVLNFNIAFTDTRIDAKSTLAFFVLLDPRPQISAQEKGSIQ